MVCGCVVIAAVAIVPGVSDVPTVQRTLQTPHDDGASLLCLRGDSLLEPLESPVEPSSVLRSASVLLA